MLIRSLVIRSRNLLLFPAREFSSMASNDDGLHDLNRRYILPVSIGIAVFSLVGSVISNFPPAANAWLFMGINTVIVFLLVLSHCYLSGKMIGLLASNMQEENNRSAVFALSCYAQLPFFIILAVTKLFPSLIFLIVLGLYTALLFYTGSSSMTRVEGEKRIQFTILSVLIMIVSFVICSELFTLLYSVILDQFSTFAA